MNDMRAALYDSYGPPEVLYEGTAPTPVPGPGEVLVRVRAVGVNGGELAGRAGRLKIVTGRTFPKRVGLDFAGEVAGTGSGVRGLGEGERVWGLLPRGRFGSAAEYVAVRPGRPPPPPAGLSDPQAASLLAGGTTAITGLVDKARLRAGERLLVRGAAGGVGSVAVQLGAALGAHVTALAGPRNLGFVRDLGAHEALSYTTTGPSDLGTFDVVFDTAGTEHRAYRSLLAPGGRMIAIAFDLKHPLPSLAYVVGSTAFGPRRVRFFSGNPRHDLLARLAGYVDDGSLREIVDTVHPLADIAAAHRALEAGGVRGKHVVAID
ncbi:NAD(P)-dependent alcohol dehydrogenase [Streptomyces sp. 8L]|uniref:NAD(P)-dependent alcohol dehydrogenase n=1 Tax=Streptomyces sp. 8L TaxID=2877242 RepID=UPI001CD7B299|nr:NAD(P)-dependent alcohol dehydrogenase [Streptomyces sp. 8L]MCA1222107.1 NAD(P)-dependent alcohol dehydrogenase [Streptomyces sp. 8L]